MRISRRRIEDRDQGSGARDQSSGDAGRVDAPRFRLGSSSSAAAPGHRDRMRRMTEWRPVSRVLRTIALKVSARCVCHQSGETRARPPPTARRPSRSLETALVPDRLERREKLHRHRAVAVRSSPANRRARRCCPARPAPGEPRPGRWPTRPVRARAGRSPPSRGSTRPGDAGSAAAPPARARPPAREPSPGPPEADPPPPPPAPSRRRAGPGGPLWCDDAQFSRGGPRWGRPSAPPTAERSRRVAARRGVQRQQSNSFRARPIRDQTAEPVQDHRARVGPQAGACHGRCCGADLQVGFGQAGDRHLHAPRIPDRLERLQRRQPAGRREERHRSGQSFDRAPPDDGQPRYGGIAPHVGRAVQVGNERFESPWPTSA